MTWKIIDGWWVSASCLYPSYAPPSRIRHNQRTHRSRPPLATDAVYGIHRVRVAPSMDSVTVDYDATRLRPAEVESALAAAGIPIAPELA